MDLVTALALLLLVAGVVGSVTPMLPGGLLSIVGIYLHWWHTGFAEPGLLGLIGFTLLGLSALVADYFGGAIAAGAGGASTRTVLAASVVGVVLLFVLGPLGMLLGMVGTVVALEIRRHGDARRGVRAGVFAVLGMLGSTLAQVTLTGAILVGFVAIVVP